MAANATISRYRPALCVLAALAAGYTIYYVHSTQEAPVTSRAQPQPLRRRHANNRRRPRPPELEDHISSAEELLDLAQYPASVWDAEKLYQVWQFASLQFGEAYILQARYWSSPSIPKVLPLCRTPPGLDVLQNEYGIPQADVKTVRQDYEEALFRTFLCHMVPPNCVLTDTGGVDKFSQAFSAEPNGLMYSDQIKTMISMFNHGAYDSWGLRKDTYKRFNVRPPEPPPNTDVEAGDTVSPPAPAQSSEEQSDSESSRAPTPPDDMDIVSESSNSWHEGENDESKREGGQTLLNMLYHIAEDQARREGYIHRGVTCDSCHTTPIHGVRYRCINCADFDLCETCEALQPHPKTHLFLKIRIPTPSYARSRRPQPLWYPGRTIGLPSSLNRDLNKVLSEQTGFTENETEALWDQFKNMAASEWREDPLQLGWAIDRENFRKCFALWQGPAPRRRPAFLVYDRLFSFYDVNNDGLIGFGEFVAGMAASKSKDPDIRLKRTFHGFDFDGDGLISRRDVLAMFKACYSLQKDLARDLFVEFETDLLEGGSVRDTIGGTQPISSAFTYSYDISGRVRHGGQGKIRNANGDLIINDNNEVILKDEDDDGDLDQIVGDLKEIAVFGELPPKTERADEGADTDTNTSINKTVLAKSVREIDGIFTQMSDWEIDSMILPSNWPPAHLSDRDVEKVLGKQLTLKEVTDIEDRRRIILEARDRIRKEHEKEIRGIVRQDAIEDRNARSHLFADGQVEDDFDQENTEANLDQDQSASKTDLGVKKSASEPSEVEEFGNSWLRKPPPMPVDVGQEILFQVTRECINEMLDPLFRYRESLPEISAKYSKYMDLCSEHLRIYRTPLIHHLSWFQLHRFLFLTAANLAITMKNLEIPLIDYIDSLNRTDSEASNFNEADKKIIGDALEVGVDVPKSLECLELLTEIEIASRNRGNNTESTKEDHQSTPSLGSDPSQQEESEIEYPAAALDLHESVRVFNENDTNLEEEILKESLDVLLEESGYSIFDNGSIEQSTSSVDITDNERPDPTLPHNRPSSTQDVELHTSESPPKPERELLPKPFNPTNDQYIPLTTDTWSPEFTKFLQFLSVVQTGSEEDEERGGPGRISYDEFYSIVRTANSDLDFLGQWIDMQAM